MTWLTFSPVPWWVAGAVAVTVLVLRYRARQRLEEARAALERLAADERAASSQVRPRSGRVENVVPLRRRR